MNDPLPANDPAPVEPEPPLDSECCESGCERCVWTVYAEARDEYRRLRTAWLRRHCASDAPAD